MPTLDWIGKKAVVNHHREVPYRLIHCDKDKSHGDPDAGNLLVQGDNLEALKALLPYYAGKVKCIFIDPPYNTGNESWVYNDNVNSPEIRAWLGSVVGKEAEDLSRHDKWLCMMFPRMRLLKEFLSEDGSIWITIDDNEGHYLKAMTDEIFGRSNFVASFVWEKDKGGRGDADVSSSHDYVLVYARSRERWAEVRNLLNRTETQLGRFQNPDNDPRGPWRQGDDGTAKSGTEKQKFPITLPSGRVVIPKRYWAFSRETFDTAVAEGRAYFGKKGDSLPIIKRYLSEVRDGVAPRTWLPAEDVGTNQSAKRDHLRKLLPDIEPFETPKPEGLIKRAIEISTNPGDIVLDSFAGSGTTAAGAQKMGRNFIIVEMGEHASSHVVPRLKKVIDGKDEGGITNEVGWTGGGGFRFCTLGEPLFDADGNVSPSVTFPDLAAHVFFCETGSPIPKRADGASPLIGTFQNRAIYLLHSAEAVGVAREQAGNVLTGAVLEALPLSEADFAGARIVYAEGCTVPDDRLSALGVTFKQIPYQIEGI
ncbi:site-specific DNA-methyltransferase [Rhizobium sp. S153]|uniref:site-specific DNA-methyltransferase (adenine-specific) n=1 Tax=Ciceribacter sichuanensis TaxID=2949647 RepID=A0ABT0V6C5_9HYPH|nr:site-specific DNA-methyltransferase [Ciceribacter sp. S153]MCM2401424.1 site-specific DNA-methyltransferase [Ciceribacter sp. S153]